MRSACFPKRCLVDEAPFCNDSSHMYISPDRLALISRMSATPLDTQAPEHPGNPPAYSRIKHLMLPLNPVKLLLDIIINKKLSGEEFPDDLKYI